MKEKIHPQTHTADVICACGERFQALSTKKEVRVELCSKCHPFFTGKQKLIDTAGRYDRFMSRWGLKRPTEDEANEAEAETVKTSNGDM